MKKLVLIRALFQCILAAACIASFPPVLANAAAPGPSVSGTLTTIPAGNVVNLTGEGEIDWVHWGLYTETSLDRKASVVPQISDFTPVDASNGFVFVYQFGDNANGYSWSDGTPTASEDNTTTGVWAYGTPLIGSGFALSAPADTGTRTLKVYVGAYRARGRFEAWLSDGSARGYTNTSLFNMGNGPSGVYALTYAAASAGQTLHVRWTLSMPNGPDGNVTLQAAALTATGVNNPPFVQLTNPTNNAALAAGGSLTLTAAANDLDGTVTRVEFYQGTTQLGEDTDAPFTYDWNPLPAGLHVLTVRAIDDQGFESESAPVELFVHSTGGSLSGSLTLPLALPPAVSLTSEGTADWIHWGLSTNQPVNRKASVTPQISTFTKLGTNIAERYGDNYTTFSWSDGTPASTASTSAGLFTFGLNDGFTLNAPADGTLRTLKVYVGLYGAQGNFQAWLSDFSAPAYTDTSLVSVGNAYAVYQLTYQAATPGQQLIVRYRSLNLLDSDFGNVTLQAATLAGSNGPTPVALINPRWSEGAFLFSFASQAGRSYEVQVTDALGSGSWQLLTTLAGDGAILSVRDDNPSPLHRFYRVISR